MLTQEMVSAQKILHQLRTTGELRHRENAHRVMPAVHMVCCLLRNVIGSSEIERFWTGLPTHERHEIQNAYEQMALAANKLLRKTGDLSPFEIVKHAGIRKLLISTSSYAAEATDKLIGPLPPRIHAKTLGLMITKTLQALTASAPILRQIRPEDGPSQESVENLRNGLAHMSHLL